MESEEIHKELEGLLDKLMVIQPLGRTEQVLVSLIRLMQRLLEQEVSK